jgi:hypothetical protein
MRLQTPQRARKTKNHQAVVWGFLVVVSIFSAVLTFYSSRKTIQIDTNFRSFFSLHQVFRQEGLQRFLEEKKILKDRVSKTLLDASSEEEEGIAANVAVYLFPEALPDSNFEKQVALEQWAPFQAAIEGSPHSVESRLWFEEMRANIWNYENASAQLPKLSQFAREVLRIYNELSTP